MEQTCVCFLAIIKLHFTRYVNDESFWRQVVDYATPYNSQSQQRYSIENINIPYQLFTTFSTCFLSLLPCPINSHFPVSSPPHTQQHKPSFQYTLPPSLISKQTLKFPIPCKVEIVIEVANAGVVPVDASDYDRAKEVKEFDETKAGIKGLLDSGITKIPRIFVHPPEQVENVYPGAHLTVPLIDLQGFQGKRREEIVNEIRAASETWGFFQMVNHGVPEGLMEEMVKGVRSFHEQPKEVKMEWYSRDHEKRVRYYCNGDLHVSKAANWRDSVACYYVDGDLDSDALPLVCRKEIGNYMDQVLRLKDVLAELLSEALGLDSHFLTSMDCMKTATLVCHYYPSCPEPDLTLGATKHSDPSYLTILLQDNIGGLQVLHQGQWVDINPLNGALIANIGDLMQLITNDKFKSVEHRVLAREVGPQISAACFFYPSSENDCKPYGPIQEFLSDTYPPRFRVTHHKEYQDYYRAKGLDGTSALPHFRLPESHGD